MSSTCQMPRAPSLSSSSAGRTPVSASSRLTSCTRWRRSVVAKTGCSRSAVRVRLLVRDELGVLGQTEPAGEALPRRVRPVLFARLESSGAAPPVDQVHQAGQRHLLDPLPRPPL